MTSTTSSLRLLSPVLVLLAIGLLSGQGRAALCSHQEMDAVFSCIIPHNQQFFNAFGNTTTCDRARITSELCRTFGTIVTCIVNTKFKCLPTVALQINPNMEIPCKVEDFFAVCTDVKNPFTADQGSSTKGNSGDDASGAGGKGATQFLWMTSLMTTFLAKVLSAGNQ